MVWNINKWCLEASTDIRGQNPKNIRARYKFLTSFTLRPFFRLLVIPTSRISPPDVLASSNSQRRVQFLSMPFYMEVFHQAFPCISTTLKNISHQPEPLLSSMLWVLCSSMGGWWYRRKSGWRRAQGHRYESLSLVTNPTAWLVRTLAPVLANKADMRHICQHCLIVIQPLTGQSDVDWQRGSSQVLSRTKVSSRCRPRWDALRSASTIKDTCKKHETYYESPRKRLSWDACS